MFQWKEHKSQRQDEARSRDPADTMIRAFLEPDGNGKGRPSDQEVKTDVHKTALTPTTRSYLPIGRWAYVGGEREYFFSTSPSSARGAG